MVSFAMPWIHRISDVDPEHHMATCANCGRVRVRPRVRDGVPFRWLCTIAERQWKTPASKRRPWTLEEMRVAAAAQRVDVCPICLRTQQLVMDHDHKSQRLRGAICHLCNVGLGAFADDPARFQRAIEYIKLHS